MKAVFMKLCAILHTIKHSELESERESASKQKAQGNSPQAVSSGIIKKLSIQPSQNPEQKLSSYIWWSCSSRDIYRFLAGYKLRGGGKMMGLEGSIQTGKAFIRFLLYKFFNKEVVELDAIAAFFPFFLYIGDGRKKKLGLVDLRVGILGAFPDSLDFSDILHHLLEFYQR